MAKIKKNKGVNFKTNDQKLAFLGNLVSSTNRVPHRSSQTIGDKKRTLLTKALKRADSE